MISEERFRELRQGRRFAGRKGSYEIRRDQNKELRVGFLRPATSKEMADDRHIANPGNFADDLGDAIIDQTRDRETLALVQINLRLRSPRADCRNEKTLNRESIRKIQ